MKRYAVYIILLHSAILLHAGFVKAQLQLADSSAFEDSIPERSSSEKDRLLKLAAGIGYAAVTYYCYRLEDNHFRLEMHEQKNVFNDQLNRFVSPLGLGMTTWVTLGVTTTFAYVTKDTRLKKTAYLWAGSLAINDFATGQLRISFQRHRPNTNAPFNTFDWRGGPKVHRSFPSFHTSTAFTTATIFATVYKEKKWVAPFAYGMATMVGLSRVYENAHWASDVMAGAFVGFLSAKLMIELDKVLSKKGILIYPSFGRHTSITLLYTFDH